MASRDKEPVFDEDNPEWTEEDVARARRIEDLPPEEREMFLSAFPRTRGAQKAPTKIAVSIRLDAEIVEAYRATGRGWQTRMEEVLRKSLPASPPASPVE